MIHKYTETAIEYLLGKNNIKDNIGKVQLYKFVKEHYLRGLSREELFERMMGAYRSTFKQSLIIINNTLYRIDFEIYKKEYKQRYSKSTNKGIQGLNMFIYNNEGIILKTELEAYKDSIHNALIKFRDENRMKKVADSMKDSEKRIKHEKFISDINQEFSERYEKQFPWNQPIKRFLSLVR